MSAPRVDRNRIPILDPPREANRLPRGCEHLWIEVRRSFGWTDWMEDRDYYRVEERCRFCPAKRGRVEGT